MCTEPRQLLYLYSRASKNGSFRGIKLVRNSGLCERYEGESMEDCELPSQISNGGSGLRDTVGSSKQVLTTNSHLPKSVKYPSPEEMEIFVTAHLCVPLDNIPLTTAWQGSKFRFLNASDRNFQLVLESLKSRVNNWNFEYFVEFYKQYKALFKAYNWCYRLILLSY